ncbi:hypothetical protein [Halanaerobacter jeridensis]|uniref:Uncharacterized protein n=1 Tax=Halanaerobacter jeridensis TaxID=706427 RepID=A0A939BRE0_9FIRM|nr:hypothetical protein [Halanaerobacter jeridensis]MBM7557259.1 hypothetical protein [Halanaerobacter jeridensis]
MDIKDLNLDDDLSITKAIMHLEDEDQGIFKHEIVGNWSIDELVEAKTFLNQLIDGKIKEKLSEEEEKELNLINMKEEDYKTEFLKTLPKYQQELYRLVNPEVDLINISDLSDEEADELLDYLDQLVEEDEAEGKPAIKHDLEKFVKELEAQEAVVENNNKVINLEDYR